MSGWIREGTMIYGPDGDGGALWSFRVQSISTIHNPLAIATMAHAAPDMIEAMKPLVDFIEAFDRKPLYYLADKFYGIHSGTEWESSLRLSDLRKLRDAYNKARGQS